MVGRSEHGDRVDGHRRNRRKHGSDVRGLVHVSRASGQARGHRSSASSTRCGPFAMNAEGILSIAGPALTTAGAALLAYDVFGGPGRLLRDRLLTYQIDEA